MPPSPDFMLNGMKVYIFERPWEFDHLLKDVPVSPEMFQEKLGAVLSAHIHEVERKRMTVETLLVFRHQWILLPPSRYDMAALGITRLLPNRCSSEYDFAEIVSPR